VGGGDAVIPNFRRAATPSSSGTWNSRRSQNSTTSSRKYFRGSLNTPQRESSVLADRLGRRHDPPLGEDDGYFASSDDATVFAEELTHLLVHQKAAFNSPVWFNVGVPDTPQQCSACFILAVDDKMSSILNWYVEGTIFKGARARGSTCPGCVR
jgi:ribonucleoside-diphosphate reductase alpha chain